jgi:hypothetical protein
MQIDVAIVESLIGPRLENPTTQIQLTQGGGAQVAGDWSLLELEALCVHIRTQLQYVGRAAMGLQEHHTIATNPYTIRKQLLRTWEKTALVKSTSLTLADLETSLPVLPDFAYTGIRLDFPDGAYTVLVFDAHERLIQSCEFPSTV